MLSRLFRELHKLIPWTGCLYHVHWEDTPSKSGVATVAIPEVGGFFNASNLK